MFTFLRISAFSIMAVFAVSGTAIADEVDACAGQVWYEYTQDCIDQIAKTISDAGDHDASEPDASRYYAPVAPVRGLVTLNNLYYATTR